MKGKKMKKTITKKKCEGKCPKCNSEGLSYGISEIVDSDLRYPVQCLSCDLNFVEWHKVKYDESSYEIEVV
jgi:transcription elongation factor Elf1